MRRKEEIPTIFDLVEEIEVFQDLVFIALYWGCSLTFLTKAFLALYATMK